MGLPHAAGFFRREAARYGVTQAAICAAVYGDTWHHLDGALTRRLLPAQGRQQLMQGPDPTRRRAVLQQNPMFGVTETAEGYWVRLWWSGGRPRVQQHFAARVLGGWSRAKAAALAFRDAHAIDAPPPVPSTASAASSSTTPPSANRRSRGTHRADRPPR